MNAKPWYQSWTLWTNIVGGLVVLLQYVGTINIVNPETLAGILAFLNFVLRFKTNSGVRV